MSRLFGVVQVMRGKQGEVVSLKYLDEFESEEAAMESRSRYEDALIDLVANFSEIADFSVIEWLD